MSGPELNPGAVALGVQVLRSLGITTPEQVRQQPDTVRLVAMMAIQVQAMADLCVVAARILRSVNGGGQ